MRALSKPKRIALLRRIANHVSRYPDRYRFLSTNIPTRRSPCGCLLGRGAAFLKIKWKPGEGLLARAANALGYAGVDGDVAFYDDMDRVQPMPTPFACSWREDPQQAVAGLRKLADELEGA